MNRPSFDVLKESWIPVVRLDGTTDELGILTCLEQAHELREIRDPSPIIEFGLYRLLVAFVLDALILAERRPEDTPDLKALLKNGQFDMEFFGKYAEDCGAVFDLFDAERPFLQTKMSKAKAKPLAGLYPVVPSGTNVGHWHHQAGKDYRASVPESTRLLTTIAPFMTSGGAGLSPSVNGAPGIYVLPEGHSLFQTLVFNIPLRNQDGGDGVATWRRNRLPGKERTKATMAEALTWCPRCIQLIPITGNEGEVAVKEMKFEKGDSTRFTWIDPNLAYRYEKDKVTPVRMRENRPLWRDAGPLSLLNQDAHGREEQRNSFQRPDVVGQAFSLSSQERPFSIQVYGMRTDMKMKIFEWAKFAWLIPAKLGQSTRLGNLVQQELDLAEKIAYGLRRCIRYLYPREGSGNKNALATVIKRCEQGYWRNLESSFRPLTFAFSNLDADAPDDPALITSTAEKWRLAIRKFASDEFERAAKDMDVDSDALERQVRARTRMKNTLKKVLS